MSYIKFAAVTADGQREETTTQTDNLPLLDLYCKMIDEMHRRQFDPEAPHVKRWECVISCDAEQVVKSYNFNMK